LKSGDKGVEAGEIRRIPRLDDLAEEDDKRDEWGEEDGPGCR
jgi:hypothetical protein